MAKMFVLVAMNPYEDGEVQDVIGPFTDISGADPKTIARVARQNLLSKGAHPDHEFHLMKIVSVAEWLKANEDSLDDSNSESDAPGDRDSDQEGHEAYQEGIQRELDNMD